LKIKLRAELKATEIEAQVNEEYEADAESEDKVSVADSEGDFGSDDLNSEVNIDMSGSRPKIAALEERIGSEPRAPWFNYACLAVTKSKPGQQQKSLDKAIKSDYFQDTGENSNHAN
jgi:hypothetical protein